MQKPFVIGITGGSGSGKTSLIKDLKQRFQGHEVCIISQDDYYKAKEEQEVDSNGVINFDLPESINRSDFFEELKELIQGGTVQRTEYVFNNDLAEASEIILQSAPVIIVEGLFVFHFREVFNLMNFKVYVHAKENLKLIRRIKRDETERNYPIDDVLYRYEKHVMPAFEKYIAPYKEESDVIINNHNDYEEALEMLSVFIKSKVDSHND